jgi:hypothetical protein
MPTPPGYKIIENTALLTTAGYTSPWFDTTGYTTLLVAAAIANSTGTSSIAVQGSFDGSTLDGTITYADTGLPISASTAFGGVSVTVKHTFIRIVWTQATATATTSTLYVQSRA